MATANAAKRRRTSGPAAAKTRSQSTLSFRSTKAGLKQTDSKKGKSVNNAEETETATAKAVSPASVDLSVGAETLTTPAEEVERQQSTDDDQEDEERRQLDKKALALPESKIKSYWHAKERARKARRVHQEALGVREKVLREFDMSTRFGPSVGIRRLARWYRAYELGMDPPIEVLAVLLKETKGPEATRNKQDVQISIIDELTLSSRMKGDGMIES